MNNKAIKVLFLIIFGINALPLIACEESSVELRCAAFFPLSERFTDIYNEVGASYQIEASTPVYDDFDGWINFDWFTKHGRSKGFHDSTRINIANISFGVKYFFEDFLQFMPCYGQGPIIPYIGIGPSFSRVWIKDKSRCTHRHTCKWAYGGVLKTGFYYFFCDQVFIDIFVDYLYQPIHFHKNVDIGGFKTGAGIGIKF
jgi:hypothetical protein